RFARLVDSLQQSEKWQEAVGGCLSGALSVSPAQPGILMGYDFHLTDDGPKLIEINNNAGGLFQRGAWLPQPEWSEWSGSLPERLLSMFPADWKTVAIMDEQISEQPMYMEMQEFARLLRETGREVFLLEPEMLVAYDNGLSYQGVHIDAIYNRHTDFYLEQPAMQSIRTAFVSGTVALNPYPRSYALLGDKRRMADMWRPGLLESLLPEGAVTMIRSVVPPTLYMASRSADEWWQQRREWVFKPAARHGGKGVMRGRDISRKRFAQLDFTEMVAQQLVLPGTVVIGGESFKVDFRLYMYGESAVALAGRVWQGSVTNFRHPDSGWAVIDIEAYGERV
ncbi:MAG: hypothetical protein Q9M13_02995, partial [Mariprofundales bacterium]|nr:hypothetical protein [Mariprofundales bacterium]